MRRERMVFILLLLFVGISHAVTQEWTVLKHYDEEHTYKIALPVGGIGTGMVSLGGRGNLQDWEIMNTPAKGYNPGSGRNNSPFFLLYTEVDGKNDSRLLEGPVPFYLYEGDAGAIATNHGLPRFGENTFDAAYPFGQVNLKTPQIPVDVRIKAFNPLIPGDIDNSSIPAAIIDFVLTNTSDKEVSFSICGSMQNFIGEDGAGGKAEDNRNTFREEKGFHGIYFTSEGVDSASEQWGNMALVTDSKGAVSYRTEWLPIHWGSSLLDFWDDFSVRDWLPPQGTKTIRYLLTWYFPNRYAWSPEPLKNYYTTQYHDAWNVALNTAPALPELEKRTIEFVDKLGNTDLPEEVLEAALFNISTLRTQTCFRLDDGNFFAWEGCRDNSCCCFGSCTHVWNYGPATAFLFRDLVIAPRMEKNLALRVGEWVYIGARGGGGFFGNSRGGTYSGRTCGTCIYR